MCVVLSAGLADDSGSDLGVFLVVVMRVVLGLAWGYFGRALGRHQDFLYRGDVL